MTRTPWISLAASLLLGVSGASQATLTITAAGTARGFSLSTFLSGYSFAGYGPLSLAVQSTGNILVGSAFGDAAATMLIFKDVDGQALGDAIATKPYTYETGNPQYALSSSGGKVYGAQAFGGTYVEFALDGSSSALTGEVARHRSFLGMWTNPADGHLISASNDGLADIDPLTGAFRIIAPVSADGVSVSPDGKVVYAEVGGTIQSFDIASGTLLHTYFTGHGPDGTGTVIGGLYDGDIIVNNNDGTVGLLDPTKADGDPDQFVIIADSGSRGDFVSPDSNNGTLFLSQNESIVRLSCGAGCTIGGPSTHPTPEPAPLLLLAGALAGLALRRRGRSS